MRRFLPELIRKNYMYDVLKCVRRTHESDKEVIILFMALPKNNIIFFDKVIINFLLLNIYQTTSSKVK